MHNQIGPALWRPGLIAFKASEAPEQGFAGKEEHDDRYRGGEAEVLRRPAEETRPARVNGVENLRVEGDRQVEQFGQE